MKYIEMDQTYHTHGRDEYVNVILNSEGRNFLLYLEANWNIIFNNF
jgi:hypothetical protein